jgi:hypothetical protein
MTLRMRDEASMQMEQFGQTTQAAQIEALQMNAALTAMGSAMTAVGSLVGQLDSPMAKMASTWLITGGAILTTTSAIIQMMPYLRTLITTLRSLAIVQTFVAALMGPIGWARIGIGLGIAGVATAGIMAATGGFSGGNQVTVKAEAFTGSQADARKFGGQVQRISRESERIGR